MHEFSLFCKFPLKKKKKEANTIGKPLETKPLKTRRLPCVWTLLEKVSAWEHPITAAVTSSSKIWM